MHDIRLVLPNYSRYTFCSCKGTYRAPPRRPDALSLEIKEGADQRGKVKGRSYEYYPQKKYIHTGTTTGMLASIVPVWIQYEYVMDVDNRWMEEMSFEF
jgi:hypothetical protein